MLFSTTRYIAAALAADNAFREWVGESEKSVYLLTADHDLRDRGVGYRCAVVSPVSAQRGAVSLNNDHDVNAQIRIEFVELCDENDSDSVVFGSLVAAIDGIVDSLEQSGRHIMDSAIDSDQPVRAGYGASTDWASCAVIVTLDAHQEYAE